ncbi:hypothetical protein DFJ73DRAFT_204935 [Zopfochytrium polystomum]|nr:hypothetical protein DFJ73DRAFT_204935 [Zopfochytrium polystomum]
MQSQFEEYRTSAEYMFNTEILKLEDELSLQSLRYEHEIMYVIQAKDKFYAEMMVSKDAKIMNLIEGSDMQTLMQKHELDIENLRKEHAREIERVKSDQESEQKNLIGLLQRQNVSLESKCEKLQTHLKTLEVRIRELMGTIDNKVKMLNDREELRLKTESEYEIKLADANARISALNQEKEHLRHKVIRLNLNAKGEGENSIENMLKRITRETADLHVEFEHLSSRHDTLVGENQVLVRRLKEREKFAEFLEKEVTRRTEEYISMTRTFEEFLSARARQSRKEKAAKLSSIFEDDANGHHSTYAMDIKKSKLPKKPTLVQTFIPAKGQEIVDLQASAREAKAMESARKMELERGYNYLKKFKTLSRAFATGDFRIIPSHQYDATLQSSSGPWQKTQLYGRLDDANAAMARLYREPTKELWDNSSKPAVYLDPRQAPREDQTEDSEVKVYEQRVNTAVPVPAATAPASPAKRSSEELRVGGTPALRRYPL